MTCCNWIWDEIVHDFICANCGESYSTLVTRLAVRKMQQKMGSAYDPELPLEQQYLHNQIMDHDDQQAEKGL